MQDYDAVLMKGKDKVNLGRIRELIDIMKEHGLSEVEIEEEGVKIRLKKGGGGETLILPTGASAAVPLEGQSVVSKSSGSCVEITSPMVGTFYRAPAPDADPFVEVGGVVDKETVVCIIEAMKVMNEIKAEVTGRVHKILVENGQPVEFAQSLFLIEPLQ